MIKGIEVQQNFSNKSSLSLRIDYQNKFDKTEFWDSMTGIIIIIIIDIKTYKQNIWALLFYKRYILKKHKMKPYFGLGLGVHIQSIKYDLFYHLSNHPINSSSNSNTTYSFKYNPTIGSEIPLSKRSSLSGQLIYRINYIYSKLGIPPYNNALIASLGYKFKIK